MANLMFRTLILFFSLLVMLRLMGKRQIGQLQPYEFAIMLISSNLITVPMSQLDTPLLWGIIPVYVLLATGLFLSWLTLKSAKMRKLICGKPRVLIDKGKLQRESLKAVRYTLNDLAEQLRSNDVFDISQVYYAVLETNGQVSVILKSPYRTLQTGDMKLTVQQETPDIMLIMDGKLQKNNLSVINKDVRWLNSLLQTANIAEKDVFVAVYNGTRVYLQTSGTPPKVKEIYL